MSPGQFYIRLISTTFPLFQSTSDPKNPVLKHLLLFFHSNPLHRYPSNSAPFTGRDGNSPLPTLQAARSPTRNTTPPEHLRELPTQSFRDLSSTFGSDYRPNRTEHSGSTPVRSTASGKSQRSRARARHGTYIAASWSPCCVKRPPTAPGSAPSSG